MMYPNPQIYPRLKTMFVHVPKTAGTAIEQALLDGGPGLVGGHTSARGFRAGYAAEFDLYFKFAVVRDPVARFRSAFRYLRSRPVHPALNNQHVHECGSLGRFMEAVTSTPGILEQAVHFLPQHFFVCDSNGAVLVDHVCRFENLQEEWAGICRRCGLSWRPLPQVNASPDLPGEGAPAGLWDFVHQHYFKDYETFGFDEI